MRGPHDSAATLEGARARVEALGLDRSEWIHYELARWWRVELSSDSEWPPWRQSGSRLAAHRAVIPHQHLWKEGLSMRVREAMTSDPACCLATDSAQDVAGILVKLNIGAIPVVTDHESRK